MVTGIVIDRHSNESQYLPQLQAELLSVEEGQCSMKAVYSAIFMVRSFFEHFDTLFLPQPLFEC